MLNVSSRLIQDEAFFLSHEKSIPNSILDI